MKGIVDIIEVGRLMTGAAQIVEVLARSEYAQEHLPGAVSIPLAELQARSEELDRDRPVVVYCYDTQCDMSPRAAAMLVHLGFAEVYDFVDGKMAWLASGRDWEGERPDSDRADAIASKAPTCDIDADIATIARLLDKQGVVVVLDGDQVVLGSVSRTAEELPGDAVVADVMEAAPRTVRPNAPRQQVADLLQKRDMDHVLVTTQAGELMGIVREADLGG